ncbi:MAG: DoxX family protein [Halodesulfurarchaeum sp.]
MVASGIETALLVGARILFGAVITFTGLNHFRGLEEMAGYAEFKGVPAPTLSVLVSGAVLTLGGLGIIVGVFPLLSALAVAGFLLVAALTMHDFWAVEEGDRENERNHFLKNVSMAGGALAIAALSTQSWMLSLGISL